MTSIAAEPFAIRPVAGKKSVVSGAPFSSNLYCRHKSKPDSRGNSMKKTPNTENANIRKKLM